MARWKLTVGHYLNTEPPVEIEFKETDRNTGRQARKVYKVPRLLDPKDAADHNYPELGEIIVCDGNNPEPRDIVFLGEPTPDMEPIDAEAKKISQRFIDSGKWTKKEEGLDFGESLIKNFMAKMDQLVQPISSGVDPQAFATMQEQMKVLMEQNAKLQSQLLDKPTRRL
jgi:hypothetical protein